MLGQLVHGHPFEENCQGLGPACWIIPADIASRHGLINRWNAGPGMATDQDFIAYVAEQAGLGSRLTYKKMFGEYAVCLDEKVGGFACDSSLFIKPSLAATTLAPDSQQSPPYPGAKHYFVADELSDDADALRRFFIETAGCMSLQKPTRPWKKKPGGAAK
jgi:TfoX/Sxy family transcriptional regulator of competence genes